MATIQWEFSNLVPEEEIPLSEGEHVLYIEEASYNPETVIYSIKFKSMTVENESSVLKFYMKSKDSLSFNKATVGTLNSLTKSIDGPNGKGVLAPTDVVHRLVKAEVKMSKPKEYGGELRQYPGIYEFKPVDKSTYDMMALSGIELENQYTEGE